MCGIVGAVSTHYRVSFMLHEALLMLQHRGQDAAGISTNYQGIFYTRKKKGLVKEAFKSKHLKKELKGKIGIGHLRYPTAGSHNDSEIQPLYTNIPLGISLGHNGNLTNSKYLKNLLTQRMRHINSRSDSEILLNIFASELRLEFKRAKILGDESVFKAVNQIHSLCRGAYSVVAVISGYGLVAFRDPHGIRPLILGKRVLKNDGVEWMVASESAALKALDFTDFEDIQAGETVIIKPDGSIKRQMGEQRELRPCIFEYVYLARPDSIIDGLSVQNSRKKMGYYLGEKIKRLGIVEAIDQVIAVPETSRIGAIELARTIGKPYSEGFVKNSYVGRTFIMPNQKSRNISIKRKLSVIKSEFEGKNILLVDDSIVRGNTSKQIIKMAKKAGAKSIRLASLAPQVRFANLYGIDLPACKKLVAHNSNDEQIAQEIKADEVIYQDIEDLALAVDESGSTHFETSCFDNNYIHRTYKNRPKKPSHF